MRDMATRLREMRERSGLKQIEMARRMGLSPSYLCLMEKGERRIYWSIAIRAAEIISGELGIPKSQVVAALASDSPMPQATEKEKITAKIREHQREIEALKQDLFEFQMAAGA